MYSEDMDIPDTAVRDIVKAVMAQCGRKGGLKRNPRKGFGTGDNARLASAERWRRYRERKAREQQ